MPKMKEEISTPDAYVAALDEKGKQAFEQIRLLAKKLIPNCTERMSYGMPAFESNGTIFWFAVWKTHYGFYPKSKTLVVFASKLKKYKTSKGCVQFPAKEALPVKLITELIKYRIKENAEEQAAKQKPKKVGVKKPAKKITAKKTVVTKKKKR